MIVGEKVYLTELRDEDRKELYSWINIAQIVHNNSPWTPVTYSNHEEWFKSIGKDPSKVSLAIRLVGKDDYPIIGVIQIISIHPIHRSAELTIRIGRDADRGLGFGTEALKLAVWFSWREINLQRLSLRVFSSNKRAIKAYVNAGFSLEGTMRRSAWIDGCWEDENIMSILKDDQP